MCFIFHIFHFSYHCNLYQIVFFFFFLEINFFFLSFSITFAITFDVVSIHQYGSLPNYDDFCFWEPETREKGPYGLLAPGE